MPGLLQIEIESKIGSEDDGLLGMVKNGITHCAVGFVIFNYQTC